MTITQTLIKTNQNKIINKNNKAYINNNLMNIKTHIKITHTNKNINIT